MLKKVTLSLLLCSGVLAGHTAYAQEGCGLYYGLDIGNGKLESEDSDVLKVKDVQGTVGCQLTNNFGVEARLGSAAKKYSNILGEADVKHLSVLGRLGYKGDRILAYGLAGLGYSNVDALDTKFGPVLGVGLELFGTPRTAVHFGYTTQPTASYKNAQGQKSDLDYGLINVGYRYYFADLF